MNATRRWRAVRTPALAFAALATLMLVLQHVSNRVLRDRDYTFWKWHGLHFYLDGWSQFDGPSYVKIVEHGYSYSPGKPSTIVWFPLYPIVIRAAHVVIGDPMVAGIFVSLLAGLVSVCLYWLWLERKGFAPDRRWVALAVLMLYPYAWYLYGVVYSDSLFLATVIGAFLLIEMDRPVLAGIVGALATATRPAAFAVIPGLIALSLERGGVLSVPATAHGLVERFRIPVHFDRAKLGLRVLAPALCIIGIGSYMLYLGIRFGDPIAFIRNERVYHPGNLPLLKRAFFVAWRDATDPRLPLTITAQAMIAGVVMASVPFVGRRFGWGYGVFTLVLVCIPTFSTEDFMGTGRYLIAAFPTAALIGEWMSDRVRIRNAWLAISGLAVVGLGMGFARSWYLS